MVIEERGSSWLVYDAGQTDRVLLSIGDRRDRFIAENVAVTIATALD